MNKPKMKMSKKQAKIATSFLSDKEYLLFDGGVRTGKTLFGMYSFVDLTILNTERPKINIKDDNTYAILGKNFRNLSETLQPIMVEKLRQWGIYPAITSFGLMFSVNGTIVRYLYYGAKDKGSISAIQGLTARAIFADEAPVLNRETLEMAISRCITYDDAKFFLTSNPEGGVGHWYYKKIINNKKLSKMYIHMTLHDNPILSKEKIDSISAAFSGSMYKQKVLGLWVLSDGAVYPNMVKLSKDDPTLKYKIITIGLDEGRKDATVLVAWGYHEEEDKWHAFDLFYDKTANGNINIQTDRIVVWLKNIKDNYACPIRLVCETNPGNMHNLLKNHKQTPKIKIEYVGKKREFKNFGSVSAIRERIDLINLMMNTDKLVIHNKAYKYYGALSNAMYDHKGTRKDDGSSDIDTLDAAEYGLKPYLKIIMNRIYAEIGLGEQS